MFFIEIVLFEVMNEWLWNIDNSFLNGVIFLDLKKFLILWIMLFFWESLNFMGLVFNF